MRDPKRSKTVLLEFAIIKCRSPYNVIIGRTRMRSLGAIERMQSSWKETQWRQHMDQMSRIREQAILRARSILNQKLIKEPMITEETWEEDTLKEKAIIHNDRPDQHVWINKKLSVECKQKLEDTLRRNVDVFAWTVMIQMDYTSLNKVCAKAMYPFSKMEEELGSLMGYQYKCFLRLLKEHSQVRMSESDEEKTRFHTKGEVYSFTHMPKGLKNSAAILQRMMDKVLKGQKGRNLEVYLEEIVVKIKTDENLIKDVEETLDKLQRVNVKVDPSKCTFGMEEGNLLGYVVTTEGIKVDSEKVKVILQGPTPRGPDEIRSLSLQLTNISRFIPKMAELMLPIRNVQKSLDAAEIYGWTIEATKALEKIKRRLAKLPTLAISKEGKFKHPFLMSDVAEDRNLLHSDGEGGPDISPQDKVLEDNLPKAQSQSGNQWPHGRNSETLWYRRTIGKMGSGIENISCRIRSKEGSRGASGEKFSGQGEQVLHMSDKNKEEASGSREKPQE
ncbi:reverse transcriptase domain-containing protein, partial [Tanacetum coccineum]